MAIKKDGSRVWIDELTNHELFCPECKEIMIPVRGEILQHHYRHHQDSNCSGESAKHWSKKYEIADALQGLGDVKVEGQINNFVADVLFEQKWAFEVVFSNPPSDVKMNDLRDSLIIFDFNDENFWNQETYLPYLAHWEHIEPVPNDFSDIVKSFGKAIINNTEIEVCSLCRKVKAAYSRIKKDNICRTCDYDRYLE